MMTENMNVIFDIMIKQHILNIIEERFGFTPNKKQINAMHVLLNEKKDLIFIGKTNFEKNIFFQNAFLIYASVKIALIIMPFKTLEDEQCKKLKKITNCVFFVLNGDSNKSHK